jgi:hypothetical protein
MTSWVPARADRQHVAALDPGLAHHLVVVDLKCCLVAQPIEQVSDWYGSQTGVPGAETPATAALGNEGPTSFSVGVSLA